jgi:hypothetical protein
MRSIPVASCLTCLVLACGGRTNDVRSDASAARDAANAGSAEANVSPDVDTGASTDARDTEASCASTQQSSVWIGQTETTVTFPNGDYDGGDPLYPLNGACVGCPGASSTLPDSSPERVVLILNPITDSVTGTITFGEDRPPAPPTDPKKNYPPPARGELTDGAIHTLAAPWLSSPPYPGFTYSLVSSYTSGSLVHLAFVPSEVWRDWCTLQDPGGPPVSNGEYSSLQECVCDGGVCRAAIGSIDRIDLTLDCNTMRGQLLWQDNPDMLSTGPVAISLQRVQ